MTNKLIQVQNELKAPKSQYNSFGNYNYRNCEDILEAVKPLLAKHGLLLTITDDVVFIGERYYIKAVATVTDGNKSISSTAYAREELSKKGMDSSQITGSASSYARKYALNGLFCIDDTRDADSQKTPQTATQRATMQCAVCGKKITQEQAYPVYKEGKRYPACKECFDRVTAQNGGTK